MTRNSADDPYADLRDPEQWEEAPANDITVRPSGSSVFSFRLKTEELRQLEAAAKASKESISEYVRKALSLRRTGYPVTPVINCCVSTPYAVLALSQQTWTEGPRYDIDLVRTL